MQLCGGTLDVEEPEDLLDEYLDPANHYAYPAYDTLVTNGSTDLVTGDLLAPVLLNAYIDLARFSTLRKMLPSLQRSLAALPAVALEDADDAAIDLVADCFALLNAPGGDGGVRGSIVAKVLHRKRPDLVPLYDRIVWTAHTAPGAIPRAGERLWVEFMRLFCQQIRGDIRDNRAGFDALRARAGERDADLTLLRIHDILVWMSNRPLS